MHFSTSALVAINCTILLLAPVIVSAAPPAPKPTFDVLIPTCEAQCLKMMQKSSKVCTTAKKDLDTRWCLEVRTKEHDQWQSRCTRRSRPVSDLQSCKERCDVEVNQVLDGCSVVPTKVLKTCNGVAAYRKKRCYRVCEIDYKSKDRP